MKRTIIYNCKSHTEATDRANMCYINLASAKAIRESRENRTIEVLNKALKTIAVFNY